MRVTIGKRYIPNVSRLSQLIGKENKTKLIEGEEIEIDEQLAKPALDKGWLEEVQEVKSDG